MNRLDILLKKWKAGSVKDPDLHLCLKVINDFYIGTVNERKPTDIEGTNTTPRESNSPSPERSKAKRLRQGPQGGPTGIIPEDQSNV